MEALLPPLRATADARRHFHAVYLHTTRAIAAELAGGGFLDAAWVERWDVVFADLYLEALTADQRGEQPSGPWAIAFAAADGAPTLPPLRHVLLGMNAHINYDLPQALLAVIDDRDLDDEALLLLRAADHRHVDEVLVALVDAGDRQGDRTGGRRRVTNRVLDRVNRLATKRFLKEARAKVWSNTRLLARARRLGEAAYTARLAEIERLTCARLTDLSRPGQVLLRLGARGFGVRLAPDP